MDSRPTSPTISVPISYPQSPREVSALVIALGDKTNNNSSNEKEVKSNSKVMCLPTDLPHGLALPSAANTITAVPTAPIKSSLRRPSSPKSVASSAVKKTVRFSQTQADTSDDFVVIPNDDITTTYHPYPLPPASSLSTKEKSDIWWQPHDYEVFSGTARLISGEIRRRSDAMAAAAQRHRPNVSSSSNVKAHQESYASILTECLQSCYFTTTTTTAQDEPDPVSNPLPPSLFAYLVHWVRSGHSRRGLERWSIAYHGEARAIERLRHIRTVLEAQEEADESAIGDRIAMVGKASEEASR